MDVRHGSGLAGSCPRVFLSGDILHHGLLAFVRLLGLGVEMGTFGSGRFQRYVRSCTTATIGE
jgi:hypothetical protein